MDWKAMLNNYSPVEQAPMRQPASVPQVQTPQINPAIMSQQAYDTLVNRINNKSLQSIEDQRKGLAEMKKQIGDYGSGYAPQMNLAPLLALSDKWAGSNLSQAYHAPESAGERLKHMQDSKMKLLGQQNNLSQSEIDLLKTQLGAEVDKLKLGQVANKGPLAGMSVEAKKAIGMSNEGVNALQGMEEAYQAGHRPSRISPDSPLIGTFVSDNPFTANQRIAAEMFGRLQSGGAINKEEEKRFIAMGPRAGDSDAIARQKMAAQKNALHDRMKLMGGSPEVLAGLGIQTRASVPSQTQQKAQPASIQQNGHTYNLNPDTGKYE